MAIYRLYSGGDGESHIEELDLASHPELTSAQATTDITFRESPPGRFSDWHTAPRRQYIFTISGRSEIGLGDGTIVHYGPGDARLVEDTTGTVGTEPVVTCVIPLAGQ